MFWLPKGWVPYAGEWILSFPRGPLGGVSINVWGMACAGVIGLVTEAIVAVWALRSKAEEVKKVEEIKEEKKGPDVEIRQRKEL